MTLLRFYHDTEKVNLQTGNPRKQVRFDFDDEDENKIMDVKEIKQTELEKKKPIVLSTSKKFKLYMMTLCNPCKRAEKVKKGSENANLIKLYDKGQQKMMEDFDVCKLMKHIHNLTVLFRFYRLKHSDLMVEVNSSRRRILNLEDDDWENELEKKQTVLTRFNTHETSSSDSDTSESASKSSKKKSARSVSSVTSDSASVKKSDRDEDTFSENTVPEDKVILVREDPEGFDFDDINETAEDKPKNEVHTNKAGPISFDAKRNENMD
jgi:hypothetical protein